MFENAPERKSRKPVHFSVYVDTKRRMSNIPMVKRIARMIFPCLLKVRLIRKRVLV